MGDPTDSVVAVANIPAVQAAAEFRVPGFSAANRRQKWHWAILNPSEEPIEVEATLFYHNEEGSHLNSRTHSTVPPMDRVSRFLWELMTEGPERSHGAASGFRPQFVAHSRQRTHWRGSIALLPEWRFGNLPVERVDSE